MIGISGRCPAERRSSSGLYPFPFDARARRGCTSISASKTGCQWCRALVSETPLSIARAYLMVVSRAVATRPTGAGPGMEISRGSVSAAVGRGGFRRSKWASYRWEVQKRRLDFYERHPKLEIVPYLIIGTLVLVLALSGGLAFANPSAKVYGYALSLVVIDVGMVFIAVLFVIAGRPLWREDHDATYLAMALGFSGIPVWGFFEIFCLNGVLFVLFPSICDARPSVGWVAFVWFVAVPAVSILFDFRRYLLDRSKHPAKT